jgi:hypothetical protein
LDALLGEAGYGFGLDVAADWLWRVIQGDLRDPAPPAPSVVDRRVVCDREEPDSKAPGVAPERVNCSKGPQKDVVGDAFRIADAPGTQVARDRSAERAEEGFEAARVTGLRPFDRVVKLVGRGHHRVSARIHTLLESCVPRLYKLAIRL